jgi:hypothetical protein
MHNDVLIIPMVISAVAPPEMNIHNNYCTRHALVQLPKNDKRLHH